MDQEIYRLQPLIEEYDKEIRRLNRKIEESGIAKEMSERVLSQCVNVSKSIDRLEEETAELIHQKELQDARAEAEQSLTLLCVIAWNRNLPAYQKTKNLVLYLRSTSLNALHFMKFLSNVARLLHKKQATLMMYIRY